MSVFLSEPTTAGEEQPNLPGVDAQENAPRGQKHDRSLFKGEGTGNMAGSDKGAGAEISATQKMISATWGSVLTSLLGMPIASSFEASCASC